jgi:hypothetical protein
MKKARKSLSEVTPFQRPLLIARGQSALAHQPRHFHAYLACEVPDRANSFTQSKPGLTVQPNGPRHSDERVRSARQETNQYPGQDIA